MSLKDPPATLRPEMLAQVTFLAPPAPPASAGENELLRLLAPRRLVEAGEAGGRVWVADQAAGVARSRAVQLGRPAGEWVEVTSGLSLTDKLISGGREGLTEGCRITVTGEEPPPTGTPVEPGRNPNRLPRIAPPAPQHGGH